MGGLNMKRADKDTKYHIEAEIEKYILKILED